MPNVLIVEKLGHLRRDCRQGIPRMSPLGMAGIGGLSLLVYVGGVAKADIGLMNVGQQETDKATQYHWETPLGASHRP